MEIIIDRDSVCMGDDFGHQKTIECSEDETIESLMDKILQTNFFPVESLKNLASGWYAYVNKDIIFKYFPINNKIDYIIDKNSTINSLDYNYIYFRNSSFPIDENININKEDIFWRVYWIMFIFLVMFTCIIILRYYLK